MRRRRTGIGLFFLLLLTAVVLFAAWVYTNWRSSLNVLPPGLTINEIPTGGMTREQALNAIQFAYTVPVTVTYAGQTLPPLLPEMIELNLDMTVTAENLDEALSEEAPLQAFTAYIVDMLMQRAPKAYDVSAVVAYSRERVDAYLERTAQKYNHAPMPSVPLPDAGTFRPPVDGTTLDPDASLPLLIDAILAAAPAERVVDLVVLIDPAPEAESDILRQAIETSLRDANVIAGIYTKDLRTGQELCMNCDVAYAGLSTLKLGIAVKLYQIAEEPLNADETTLIDGMLTKSDNASANLILAEIGAGDAYTGALQVTHLLWDIGLINSFIAVPYDLKEGIAPPGFVTPANSRTDINTQPDDYIQTTPEDMGLLLEGVYHCAHGGGFLRLLYPQEITPGECQDLLAWTERNQINSLLGEGMPEGTRVAHKHGWRGDTHADVSLVYGHKTTFIAVAFLYQPEWLVWEDSVPTFAQIGQLIYRFYNGE